MADVRAFCQPTKDAILYKAWHRATFNKSVLNEKKRKKKKHIPVTHTKNLFFSTLPPPPPKKKGHLVTS